MGSKSVTTNSARFNGGSDSFLTSKRREGRFGFSATGFAVLCTGWASVNLFQRGLC
jgi:hypothetical protein